MVPIVHWFAFRQQNAIRSPFRFPGRQGVYHDDLAVHIIGREWARAEGRSKKEAEQRAAAAAAFLLDGADLEEIKKEMDAEADEAD